MEFSFFYVKSMTRNTDNMNNNPSDMHEFPTLLTLNLAIDSAVNISLRKFSEYAMSEVRVRTGSCHVL
jgi:hypothetical protein